MSDILWAVADCETDSFDGKEISPFVWGILDSDGNYNCFWNTKEFTDYVRASGLKYLYAHNGGKFDWFFPEIISEFEEGKIMLINSRLARAKIGKTELRDSFLCLPVPLSKFGEKDDFDYSILNRELKNERFKNNKQKIEKYLRQDCVALFNAMERYTTKYGHALTQSGAALKTWENMGGEKRRYGKKHDDNFRKYFYGGRTQVFKYANGISGNYQLWDIKSSYPDSMRDEHPCGADYYETTDYQTAPGASFWTLTAISRAALPIKTKFGTSFPDSELPQEFNCTGWELKAGIDTGTLKIISARGLIPLRFENMRPYVEKFYSEKLEAEKIGDTIGRELAKVFMNSCYGKFGSNPDEYKDYKIIKVGENKKGWLPHVDRGEYEIVQRDSQVKNYFDVAMAASITGHARAKLWRAICSSKNVFYCDTDSILCEELVSQKIGKELGNWDLECLIKKIWIAGKKCYVFEKENGKYKIAHKGISKLDIQIEDIKRAAAGEVVEIEKSAPAMSVSGKQKFFNRKIRRT